LRNEDVDEVVVLRPAGDQLANSEIVGIETPTSRFRAGIDLGDESVDPTIGEYRRFDLNPIDVKAERLMEVRFLTERAVEVVRQPIDLVSIYGDRQDVDFRRHHQCDGSGRPAETPGDSHAYR
jgi:hypothetical protein